MSLAIHFVSKCVPGHGPSDGRFLPCSGLSGSAVCISPSTPHGPYKQSPKVNNLSLQCSLRNTHIRSASSGGSNRRNSDYSRHNKHGFSRGRNRQNDEGDNLENFEESEMFSSKNGPLLTSSGSAKFQATSTPGPREKEIVELFRKVQAQLRERAAVKEEKKIEESQKKGKESETVDSLLKLLRKHSVQQGKRSNDAAHSRDFILDPPNRSGLFSEEGNTSIFESNSNEKHEKRENEATVTSRPRSNFQRRSPVHRKVQPVYTEYDEEHVISVSQTDFDGKGKNITLEPELEVEPEAESDNEPTFSEEGEFDVMSDDEISDGYEDENPNASQQNADNSSNLSEMKLTELKALAKSRGLKGFSKLKKDDLIELLTGDSI